MTFSTSRPVSGTNCPGSTRELAATSSPTWDKKKGTLSRYGMGGRRLEAWRLEGYVRSVKFDGGSKSSARLYFCPDIEDLMFRLSAGQRPQVKLGRRSP